MRAIDVSEMTLAELRDHLDMCGVTDMRPRRRRGGGWCFEYYR